jgi:hypothetical protein
MFAQFKTPKPGLGKLLRGGWMVLFRNKREPESLSKNIIWLLQKRL